MSAWSPGTRSTSALRPRAAVRRINKFVTLNPGDSIVDWVVKTVPTMGAGWCPPGILGIGIGGTVDRAMVLAKESLMEPIDIQELMERGPVNRREELRLEIYEAGQ